MNNVDVLFLFFLGLLAGVALSVMINKMGD